jgi:hypothetical protein
VLDHRVRQDQVECFVLEGQRHAVRQSEAQITDAALARQPDAGVAEPVDRIDPHHFARFFSQRQRHSAAAASGVEHAAGKTDTGALQERDHLGAPVVLEQRVVVFGAESQVGVRLDGAFVNGPHAFRSVRPCRVRKAFPPRRRS